jgi:hypothetical protein
MPSIANHGYKTVGETTDEGLNPGRVQCRPELLVVGVRLGVAHVGRDGVVKQIGVLCDVPDGVMERLQRHVSHVIVTDPD